MSEIITLNQFKYRRKVILWMCWLIFMYWMFFFIREGMDYLIAKSGNPDSSYTSDVHVTPVKIESINGCTGGKDSICNYTVAWSNGERYYIQSTNAYAVGQTIYHSAWTNSDGVTFIRYSWSPAENKTPATWLSRYFMKDNSVKPKAD